MFKSQKYKYYLSFVLLITLLSLLNLSLGLNFHFILDDWMNIWFVLAGDVKNFSTQFDYHPANYIVFLPFIYIFRDNPIPYNYLGLIAKIFASLTVGLMTAEITGKRKAFYFSAIIYASYFGAEESIVFTTARNNIANLILTCLTIYFYLTSFHTKNRIFLIFCLAFLFLTILADPIRMIFVPLLMIVFLFIVYFKKNLTADLMFIKAILIIIVTIIALFSTVYGRQLFFPGQEVEKGFIYKSFSHTKDYPIFIINTGNLITSYFRIPLTSDVIPNVDRSAFFIGILFVFFLIVYGIYNIIKGNIREGFFIPSGILLFLFINWLAFTYIVAPAHHRYQTISSAFFIALVTSLLLKITGNKKVFFITCLIVVINLFHSFLIIKYWDGIRNYNKVQHLINKQIEIIPQNSDPKLFTLQGSSRIVSEQFGWSFGGTVPYSFRKGLYNRNDIPSFSPDFSENSNIYCNLKNRRPVIADWTNQKEKMSISQVYGFKINDQERMENITDLVRMTILGESQCTLKTNLGEVSPGIYIENIVFSPELFTPKMVGVYVEWKIDNSIHFVKMTYRSSKKISSDTVFEIKPQRNKEAKINHILVINSLNENDDLFVELEYCTDSCILPSKYEIRLPIKYQ